MGPTQFEMQCISLKVQLPVDAAAVLAMGSFLLLPLQVQELLKDHPDVVASLNKLFDRGGAEPAGLREALLR